MGDIGREVSEQRAKALEGGGVATMMLSSPRIAASRVRATGASANSMRLR
jgi:hypothetical protein